MWCWGDHRDPPGLGVPPHSALLVFCDFIISPWLLMWTVTPPGIWRGSPQSNEEEEGRSSSTQCQRMQQCWE